MDPRVFQVPNCTAVGHGRGYPGDLGQYPATRGRPGGRWPDTMECTLATLRFFVVFRRRAPSDLNARPSGKTPTVTNI